MVLLSSMMRAEAITGRTGYVDQWLGGRQFGRWVYQTAPTTQPAADPAESLKTLTDLHERGLISDAELEALRRRIQA
jgi:hypothetical protein